ncbi:hypothetical protein D5F92_06140 [Streptococcus agalactiae]|nr:hypothetical protein B7936_07955 [Streptococcus agalactiae]OTG45610.1 hypothetical protein B7935_08595 [Streptococcus agalactiae]OTG46827.1 hypothetical protein B7934_08125 [Streptococcus agalactiae]OTG50058.1 hypothetical protein B7933_08630 [Streptococcus agalactiae]OTG50839.1 hypothetical protein B7932_08450 [Streptococcus agalactiae]
MGDGIVGRKLFKLIFIWIYFFKQFIFYKVH